MKRAIITVGISAGDEGKGSCVDYLCRLHNARLVVRYSGGCQCAHNVVLPNGKHHCFRIFGSGTFVGTTRTYVDKNVIIEPETLFKETKVLEEKGVYRPNELMVIHPKCLVTTPWHILMNKAKEIFRGVDQHGSCAMGVGQTRKYNIDHGEDSLKIEDVHYGYKFDSALQKTMLIRERFLDQVQNYENSEILTEMYKISPKKWLQEVNAKMASYEIKESYYCNNFDNVVFEGAQGVLLDEYYGFHPHTTWSTTTSRQALEFLDDFSNVDTTVLGILRTYQTRHGHGPLPSVIPNKKIEGEHNIKNKWQGDFRVGTFDIPMTNYGIRADGHIDGLFLTCLDHVYPKSVKYLDHDRYTAYFEPGLGLENPIPNLKHNQQIGKKIKGMEGLSNNFIKTGCLDEVLRKLDSPVLYESFGKTHLEKAEI